MVIWEVQGAAIGPDEANVNYFAKKGDAAKALTAFKKKNKEEGTGPTQCVVKGREELVALVLRAMALGAGLPTPTVEDDAGGLL